MEPKNVTAAADANEGRNVTKFDTLGAYLHTEMEYYIIIFLEGTLDEWMVKAVMNIYEKYVIMSSNWKPLLYLMIQKVLYILIRSLLLLFMNQVKDIDTYRFKLNQYNSCIGKKRWMENRWR